MAKPQLIQTTSMFHKYVIIFGLGKSVVIEQLKVLTEPIARRLYTVGKGVTYSDKVLNSDSTHGEIMLLRKLAEAEECLQ